MWTIINIIFNYYGGHLNRSLVLKEKDSQEGLKMESSRQKETGKAKDNPEKNHWGRL